MKHLIYAIGDVHGCDVTLSNLFQKITNHMNANPADKRTVIFLGDYVDRGPRSAQVLDRVMSLIYDLGYHDIEVIPLKGNHEDMMIEAIENPMYSGLWIQNGGGATINSYPDGTVYPEHLRFMKNLKLYHQIGRFVFVHAGIEPLYPIEEQSPHTFLWERSYVKYNGPFDEEEKMFVVHGHTPGEDYVLLDHQLNIDSACVFGENYKLTCVVIDADQEDNNFEYLQEKNADRISS